MKSGQGVGGCIWWCWWVSSGVLYKTKLQGLGSSCEMLNADRACGWGWWCEVYIAGTQLGSIRQGYVCKVGNSQNRKKKGSKFETHTPFYLSISQWEILSLSSSFNNPNCVLIWHSLSLTHALSCKLNLPLTLIPPICSSNVYHDNKSWCKVLTLNADLHLASADAPYPSEFHQQFCAPDSSTCGAFCLYIH